MPNTPRDAPLGQGGPGEQAGPRPAAGDDGRAASQQGSPRRQAAAAPPADPPPAAARRPDTPAASRPLAQSERDAASPDPRATTDWSHGEGEPPRRGRDPQAP